MDTGLGRLLESCLALKMVEHSVSGSAKEKDFRLDTVLGLLRVSDLVTLTAEVLAYVKAFDSAGRKAKVTESAKGICDNFDARAKLRC